MERLAMLLNAEPENAWSLQKPSNKTPILTKIQSFRKLYSELSSFQGTNLEPVTDVRYSIKAPEPADWVWTKESTE